MTSSLESTHPKYFANELSVGTRDSGYDVLGRRARSWLDGSVARSSPHLIPLFVEGLFLNGVAKEL